MPYTDYFHPGPPDPTDLPRLSLREIDAYWHVIATEPGHCEHVHGQGFRHREAAARLMERIWNGLQAGRRLDIIHSWETRALIEVPVERETRAVAA